METVTDWSRICNFVINKVNIKFASRRVTRIVEPKPRHDSGHSVHEYSRRF